MAHFWKNVMCQSVLNSNVLLPIVRAKFTLSNRLGKPFFLLSKCPEWDVTNCSSGYGRWLMIKRTWVWIPAPYTGWTWHFSHWFVVRIVLFAWKRPKINEKGSWFDPFIEMSSCAKMSWWQECACRAQILSRKCRRVLRQICHEFGVFCATLILLQVRMLYHSPSTEAQLFPNI